MKQSYMKRQGWNNYVMGPGGIEYFENLFDAQERARGLSDEYHTPVSVEIMD